MPIRTVPCDMMLGIEDSKYWCETMQNIHMQSISEICSSGELIETYATPDDLILKTAKSYIAFLLAVYS